MGREFLWEGWAVGRCTAARLHVQYVLMYRDLGVSYRPD